VGTMLSSKSLLFFCIGSIAGQSFFHTTHGNGGSYTSITHGAAASIGSAGPVYKTQPIVAAQTYAQPAATYSQPAATYSQPAATYHQPAATYHKPAASYHKPAPVVSYAKPTYRQQPSYPEPHAAAPTYGEKCALEYEEKYAEVCTPTLETNCEHDQVADGIRISQQYDCYPVTRTICTEYEDIELVEVCAVAYSLEEVASTSRLVDVKWEKECKEEVFCENPHAAGAYHSASYCKEQIKSVCALYPVLYPVDQTVVLRLPQPYDTCITKEIILPRVKCQQVTEKRCVTIPKTVTANPVDIDKCTVSLGPEQCTENPIKLPKQACLETFKKVKLVYEEDGSSYAARY